MKHSWRLMQKNNLTCILHFAKLDRLRHPLYLSSIQLNWLWTFNCCLCGKLFRGIRAENNSLKVSLVSPHSCSLQYRCQTRLMWTAGIQREGKPINMLMSMQLILFIFSRYFQIYFRTNVNKLTKKNDKDQYQDKVSFIYFFKWPANGLAVHVWMKL